MVILSTLEAYLFKYFEKKIILLYYLFTKRSEYLGKKIVGFLGKIFKLDKYPLELT